MLACARTLLALAASTFATSALASMPLLGPTSQPIGHYEFCQAYPDQCAANASVETVTLTAPVRSTLGEVNNAVNVGIFPRTDQEMHGVPERWSYPQVQGDCEDYALLKQYMLERAGLPRSALLLTVLRQQDGSGHAVLTVTTDKGDLVLDNLEDGIRDWAETSYTYLKRQSAAHSGKWVAIKDARDMPVGSVR